MRKNQEKKDFVEDRELFELIDAQRGDHVVERGKQGRQHRDGVAAQAHFADLDVGIIGRVGILDRRQNNMENVYIIYGDGKADQGIVREHEGKDAEEPHVVVEVDLVETDMDFMQEVLKRSHELGQIHVVAVGNDQITIREQIPPHEHQLI